MKALVYVGAFNPPTGAHIDLAQYAMCRTGADKVIYVPSKSTYIKYDQGKDFAYSDRERLDMLQRAAKTRPWMAVSDWDIVQQRQPRTYDTLCHFRENGLSPALLMGSDKLTELETGWLHVEEIAREFGIVCLARGSDACARMIQESDFLRPLSPFITVLETPPDNRNISSSAVRQCVSEIKRLEEQLRRMVPEDILPCLRRGFGE